MTRNRCVAGFSIVELIVVSALVGALIALTLPAIQSARESSRASACRNNLRQVGIALLQFESAQSHFPKGAAGHYNRKLWPGRMFGFSWWPYILPHLEHQERAGQLDYTGSNVGWVYINSHNGRVAHQFEPSFWFCPSSPIPKLLEAGGYQIAAPSYTGISGATSHNGFPETRVSPCCRSNGEISAGGMLIPNAVVRLAHVEDGLSHTLLVGEQSDFAYNKEGISFRIDAAFATGWLCGTDTTHTVQEWNSRDAGVYNLSSIRYGLNERRYDLPGIFLDHGANNPLLSPHPGIVHLLRGDGSVHATSDFMDPFLLKQLATRDDGTK
jgi:type II secretory pathway pseudopilin PulG